MFVVYTIDIESNQKETRKWQRQKRLDLWDTTGMEKK